MISGVDFQEITEEAEPFFFKEYGLLRDPGMNFTGKSVVVKFRYEKDGKLYGTTYQYDVGTNGNGSGYSPHLIATHLTHELGVPVQVCFIEQRSWTSYSGNL